MTKETKGWTPERRQAARERILKNKPWEKSTGPRTADGKAISSMNALTHGLRSDCAIITGEYITASKKLNKECRRLQKQELEARKLGYEMLAAFKLIEFKSLIKDLSVSRKKP